jgi:hypothetical protein
MDLRKTHLFIALIALIGLSFAQTANWIPFDNAPETRSDMRVLASDNSHTVVELELSGIYVETRTIGGIDYHVVTIPALHAGVLGKTGSPELPVVSRLLAIPPYAGVRVSVLELDERTLSGFNVYPAQPPQPEDRVSESQAFVRDEARYALDQAYPDAWSRAEDPAVWRDYRVVPLVIQPVRCNPVTGELRVARRIRIELTYEGRGINPKTVFRPFISRAFEPLYRRFIANLDVLPPTSPLSGTYLIIANDSFFNDVKPLADWKHRKGWRVKLVRTSEIGGQDSAHVYNYIHDGYLHWPYPIDYVLLVGDVEFVARGVGTSGVGTDHCFTRHEGTDYLSEVLISRISVKTHAECQTAVNKLVNYETDPYLANPDWFHKTTTIGGYEGTPRFWATCIQVRNELLAHSPMTQVDTLFERWGTATAANVSNAVNEGRSWLLYRGHGAVNYWDNVTPDYTNSHVYALTNGRMTPMVVGPTCLSGKYDDPSQDCLAEAFIKAGTPTEAKGGCGYFGASEVSYTGHNDSLALGTFVGFCESLNLSMTQSTYYGKMCMYRGYPPPNSTTQLEFDMFNTFGEPELQIYSGTPAEPLVDHPATVRVGACQFPVQVGAPGPVENALVCVMCREDTTVWQNGYTDVSGQITFTLNCTQPGDSLFVTVTGRNLHTYRGAAMVITSNTPYVSHLRHLIDDAAGNGDSIVNPGEAIRLPTWFKNWGSVAANGVTARLRSTDPMVTITDSARTLGDIPAGDSVFTGSPGFGFTASPACSNGYALRFSLLCRDSYDSTWTSQFSILCGTPVLRYADQRVEDPQPGGNNNGQIDPGEDARLYVTLANTGLGHGYSVQACLRAFDSRFQVLDSLAVYGTILRDSAKENTSDEFAVHADISIPPEMVFTCTLLVTATGGHSVRLPFNITVGGIRSNDPIPDNGTPTVYWAYDDADSNYVQHPQFNWIEVNTLGTRLTLTDDQTVTITLPTAFGPFRYYGQRYTTLSICSNGFVMPGAFTVTAYSNAQLPTSTLAAPAICLDWDDLNPTSGGAVYWYHDTTRHAFIVEYDSVAYYSPSSMRDKYEVVILDSAHSLNAANDILVQYLTAANYTSSTVGIQNANYTIGINCLFNGAYHRGTVPLHPRSAIRYLAETPITGIASRDDPVQELGEVALGVFPNPFRDKALIRWQVRTPGRVLLKVFDIAGRTVATLCDAELKPGTYTAPWAGVSDQGRVSAAGIYFCRLVTLDRSITEKVVLTEGR